ncbi:hypothetical protein [Pedobacter caeni]|uniref:Uncharacterized protein n=1 Tax=Pedobacter caeni TaxID=288992 RepID=A0A1M5GVY5_9SPHI|nr:hypothetical protein [Pedobacter caeni]SHG07916.1 hypothetical protein SAMN04488522_104394 [Pedobacter caeni]
MIDLDNFNLNKFEVNEGGLLAASLEMTIFQRAAIQVILRNQAEMAHKLDPTIDEEIYFKSLMDETINGHDQLKAMIYSKII